MWLQELASEWADRLINITRLALSTDKSTRGYFHGTSACLSALFTAGRYEDLIELVRNDVVAERIASDTVREWRATVLDDSVARQDTKGLPTFDSVDRKIRAIRREHGRAIELLGQRDESGIRKVHRQIGVLVEQLPDTLQ